MVRVLHIMSGDGGGISSFIQNKAKEFQHRSIAFDVLTYDTCSEPFIQTIEETGGKVSVMPNPKKAGWKAFYTQVNSFFSEQESDTLIHSHIQGYRALPFYLIAQKNKLKRFVVHAHTDRDQETAETIENKLNRILNNRIARQKVSCGMEASKNIFGEKAVQNKTVMHIPNSIDEQLYLYNKTNTGKLRAEVLGAGNTDKLIIGHVGRFHKAKNHLFMVQIIEQLNKLGTDFLWLFIGQGSLKDEIQTTIREKGLQERVLFLGRRSDVADLYSLLDVFVLPSLYEGLPTVAIEAQAAGVVSLLSEKITEESDLGMGLVQFEPIFESEKLWAQKIIESKEVNIPSVMERKTILEKKKFANSDSADLYEDFIREKITHYEI